MSKLTKAKTNSSDVALKVEHVSKSFRLPTEKANGIKQAFINRMQGKTGYTKQEVLKDISFEVKKGDFFGIVGRNGSGKSTLARNILELSNGEAEHYEADMFFMVDGVYNFDATKIKEAHAWCYQKVRDCLLREKVCIVSNTFVKLWEMKPYLDLKNELSIEVHVIEALGNYGNVHNVPLEVIERMRSTWEELP